MSANLDDTIVAISTPAGRGGLGVVRLAGPEARAIAGSFLRLTHELEHGRAIFGEVVEPESGKPGSVEPERGERIDEAVVTFFEKPHSYTTDDIVEISAHGSPVVLAHMVELAMARGARLAEPGEFTMRAFLNGRIDLTQAEAVRDLIESQTLYQAKVAAQQLEGAVSKKLAPIKSKLVALIAEMEAGVDFAEDDVSVLSGEQIAGCIAAVRAPLEELAHSLAYGKIVNQGLTLAIVGQPNVGKSSLFNRLVERERAIVTASPGTTRDLVMETVSIGGIPVRLVDTAGIRAAGDEAESLGVRKSYEALADADLAVVVLDASQPQVDPDPEILRRSAPQKTILVENKRDIASSPGPGLTSLKRILWDGETFEVAHLGTSALTGEGIAELRAEILRRVGGNGSVQRESGVLTNLRQQALVRESLAGLEAASAAAADRIPHEMILLDLYNGLRPLDAITGATTTDDILNLIFSGFCIGK